MIYDLVTLADEEFVLLLVRPDWRNKRPETWEHLETDIEETIAAVEHRRAAMDRPLLGITYSALLEDEDWQTWRGLALLIAGRRVACPIWPDLLPAADWALRVHDTDYVAGWSGVDFDAAALGTRDAPPDRDFLVPLVVGRLQLNEDSPLSGALASVTVRVDDDRAGGTYTGSEEPEGMPAASTPSVSHPVFGRIDLAWEAYPPLGTTGYEIWFSRGSGDWELLLTPTYTETSAHHALFETGVFSYRMRALTTGGASPFSETASIEIFGDVRAWNGEVSSDTPGSYTEAVGLGMALTISEGPVGIATPLRTEGVGLGMALTISEGPVGIATPLRTEGVGLGMTLTITEVIGG